MKKYAALGLIFMVVFVAVTDVYLIAKGGTEASYSHMIWEMSHKFPALTFFFGFLCGHLFWRIRDTKTTKRISEETRK